MMGGGGGGGGGYDEGRDGGRGRGGGMMMMEGRLLGVWCGDSFFIVKKLSGEQLFLAMCRDSFFKQRHFQNNHCQSTSGNHLLHFCRR